MMESYRYTFSHCYTLANLFMGAVTCTHCANMGCRGLIWHSACPPACINSSRFEGKRRRRHINREQIKCKNEDGKWKAKYYHAKISAPQYPNPINWWLNDILLFLFPFRLRRSKRKSYESKFNSDDCTVTTYTNTQRKQ